MNATTSLPRSGPTRTCSSTAVASDAGSRSVLALVHDAPGGTVLALTNLADSPCRVDLGPQREQAGSPVEVFSDHDYDAPTDKLTDLELGPYGYRWIRLRRTLGV